MGEGSEKELLGAIKQAEAKIQEIELKNLLSM